jgi:hypothetical protein
MAEKPTGKAGKRGERKARLADALRVNLQRRKGQARARRAGEADRRDEGIAAAEPPPRK